MAKTQSSRLIPGSIRMAAFLITRIQTLILMESMPESFLQIVAMPAPRRTDPSDSIGWKHSPDGRFSIKSAYRNLSQHPVGHEKQATHDRLLTNDKRHRWYGVSPMCQHCQNHIENTIHVLRDCRRAKSIWDKLVKPNAMNLFYNQPKGLWRVGLPMDGVNNHTRMRLAVDLVLRNHNPLKDEICRRAIKDWDSKNESKN
ncbi:hypothetical protein Ahy_A09g043556 [Arachis hypogaea]|uniref:Reverse transcriptase zinc-binding domain-containing protein n=1 Tax=Arachis hypogaea TaxID=3818 RepID=A0A445BIK7_ARAHY|nr:hypothetical protein Ahy_A09g043556 [Arachis hypogaea]